MSRSSKKGVFIDENDDLSESMEIPSNPIPKNKVYKEKAYFDFGTSNINQGQQFNHGLLAWKESFGARSITQDFYTVKTKNVNRLNNLMS